MTWFKVDDSFHSHPKPAAAPLAAIGLWTLAGSWCGAHLTDGNIPLNVLKSLSRGAVELADELVACGLWRRTKSGYRFHQWHADTDGTPRNPTRSEAMSARSRQSSGGAIGNHRRWHVDKGKADPNCRYCQQKRPSGTDHTTDRVPDGGTESEPSPPVPARPDPSPSSGTGGGIPNGEMRARASPPPPQPPGPEPPQRCPDHHDTPTSDPCRVCGDARRTHQQWLTRRAAWERHAPRCRTHRGQTAHNCALCRADQLADEPQEATP